MAYIVAEPCIRCKYVDCVAICPVMCFHEGANCLVIDPDECIDCGACVDQCPVNAIYPEESLPEKWREYVDLNARFSKEWPTITMKKEPLASADEYKSVENKRSLLDPAPGNGDA
ncbi:MAG: ferredoxin family protein [Candidatus Hydrogenedentes bacterium]|nr:ferredoxin family protein [Candidatus Hydrogenedentota bacterium]